MKTIYILLSCTGTSTSRFIKMATNAEYTHASIALIPSGHNMYSFGRRRPRNFLIGGFINEDINKHVLGKYPNAPCVVLALDVSDKAYEKMEMMVSEFNRQYDSYKYSFIGAATSFFGIKKNLRYRYTCSQFVASMLYISDAVELPKHPSLMKPMDFLKIPELRLVYKGELSKIRFPKLDTTAHDFEKTAPNKAFG